MPITTVFDFIDELEKLNPVSGTANENRAFVYSSLYQFFDELSPDLDLYGAYQSIGINIPQKVFDAMIDHIGSSSTIGDMVQFFAPTSKVTISDLPIFKGEMDENYIVYSQALVYNPVTGDSYIDEWYHKFSEDLTTSELEKAIANDIFTLYGRIVSDVTLKRIYRNG